MDIKGMLRRIIVFDRPASDDRVRYEDGVKYEKHTVRTRLLGYPIKDMYYPVAEDDPLRFLFITFTGGIFGIHRFITGEWVKGLFYLLTCGGFGVFYCSDIISILLGTYYIRQIEYVEEDGRIIKNVTRIYLDHLPKGRILYGIMSFILAAVIAFFAYTKVYIPLLSSLGAKAAVSLIKTMGE